jgi:hypothetical protein
MSQSKLLKLEKINAQIIKLEQEKKELRDTIKQNILNFLDEKILLNVDFETLVGGMLNLQKTLLDSSDISKKQKEIWKKEGSSHFQKGKKTISEENKVKDY